MRKSIEVLLNIAIALYISLLKQLGLSPASSSAGKNPFPWKCPVIICIFWSQNFHIKNIKKQEQEQKEKEIKTK